MLGNDTDVVFFNGVLMRVLLRLQAKFYAIIGMNEKAMDIDWKLGETQWN